MNKLIYEPFVSIAFFMTLAISCITSASAQDENLRPLKITSLQSALTFNQRVSIGNGQNGTTIFGNVEGGYLALNEVALWSSEPSDWNNPDAKVALPEIRRMLFDGKIEQAELLCRRLQAPSTQTYFPMADLEIRFLPALPPEWPEGYMNDLCARGCYTVDVERRGGTILQGTIHAKFDGKFRLRIDSPVTVSSNGQRVSHTIPEENEVEFDVKAGQTYELRVPTSTG